MDCLFDWLIYIMLLLSFEIDLIAQISFFWTPC